MENATKALIIAAAVLFAIMILTLLVAMYNQISSHYQQEHELMEIEQLEKFNRQFENYNRQNLRGNELISLMNKIIDYNANRSYDVDEGYKRILVNIDLKGLEGQLRFEISENEWYDEINELIPDDGKITNATGDGDNYFNDRQLVAITGTSNEMIKEAEWVGFDGVSYPLITDTKLQQLQSKISNIIIDEDSTEDRAVLNRYYRANILEDLLGWNIEMSSVESMEGKYITSESDSEKMEKIKYITNQYYQYVQFKRVMFDCKNVIYDSETNRIVKMEFEVQTKTEGENEVIVFD